MRSVNWFFVNCLNAECSSVRVHCAIVHVNCVRNGGTHVVSYHEIELCRGFIVFMEQLKHRMKHI